MLECFFQEEIDLTYEGIATKVNTFLRGIISFEEIDLTYEGIATTVSGGREEEKRREEGIS